MNYGVSYAHDHTDHIKRMRCCLLGHLILRSLSNSLRLLSTSLCLSRAPPLNASRRRLSSSLSPPPPRMEKKSGGGQPAADSPDHPKDEAYLQAVISKRISAFESIKSEQVARLQSISDDAIKKSSLFERIEVTREQALEMFSENKFKIEIIRELPEDKTITVYRCGPLVDLCRGPHIPNTSFVKALACLKASSAYWRGNKDRESLQRVYGISYPDQKRLKDIVDAKDQTT